MSHLFGRTVMNRLGHYRLLAGILFLVPALLIANGWRSQINNAQQSTHVETKIDPTSFEKFVGQYIFINDPESVLSCGREGDKFGVQATTRGRVEIFRKRSRPGPGL